MDETKSFYASPEEQDANAERVKFIAWLVVVGITGLAIGFIIGGVVSGQIEEETPELFGCAKYEIQGSTFAPVCVDRRPA